MTREWQSAEHAAAYLERADRVPHRSAGETTLVDEIPAIVHRVLDLGSGDGRLLDLVLRARPDARGVALDFSPPSTATGSGANWPFSWGGSDDGDALPGVTVWSISSIRSSPRTKPDRSPDGNCCRRSR